MNAGEFRDRALDALKRGDVQHAIECFRESIRIEPANAGTRHELAECYWAAYEFDLALDNYEAAHGLSASTDTCVLAANKLFSIARFEESARWLERALTIQPRDAVLITMLGEVSERDNRLDEAERCADEALELNPQSVKAVRLRAHIDRRRGQFEMARGRLNDHLRRWTGAEDWRLRYELAAVLDRLGEYDAAIQELLLAKEQLRSKALPCLAQANAIQQRQIEIANLLRSSDFKSWHDEPHQRASIRIAFLCGHPRSGTTLLEQILGAHDNIVTSDETAVLAREFIEPMIRQPADAADCVTELRNLGADQISDGRAAYLRFTEAHLGEAIGSRLIVDKDPSLTPDLPLPLRMFPEARVIFPLRDPRDVCVSYFFTLIPLAPASAAALDLKSTCEFCAHSLRLWDHWKKTLPYPLMELRYEDLVTGPEVEARRLFRFLGVPWSEQALAFHEKARSRGIRTPTYADASQPIYQRAVGRWKNYERHVKPHLGVLEPYLRSFGYP